MSEIEDDNIDIMFMIYSGNPDVIISFDKEFPVDKVIMNSYIYGTINWLATPQIRNKFGFNGTIYIQVKSYWTASYKIVAWLNRKDFLPIGL